MIITELSKTNPRITDSRNVDCGLDGHCIIVSKNRQVDDRLVTASLILRSQPQRGSGYAINFLKNFNMIFQFFSGSRHLGFEDVQAVVDLIGDAVQISGLFIDLLLYHCLSVSTYNLVSNCIPFLYPAVPLDSSVQSVLAKDISRCNEASTLTCNEVFFNSFPVYHQRFTHAVAYMHRRAIVKASLIRGFIES